jgi:hypothetical protein
MPKLNKLSEVNKKEFIGNLSRPYKLEHFQPQQIREPACNLLILFLEVSSCFLLLPGR